MKGEIGLQVSFEEARLQIEQLERQRDDLREQLRKLERDRKRCKKDLDGGKRVLIWLICGASSTSSHPFQKVIGEAEEPKAELARIDLEISSLQEEIVLR